MGEEKGVELWPLSERSRIELSNGYWKAVTVNQGKNELMLTLSLYQQDNVTCVDKVEREQKEEQVREINDIKFPNIDRDDKKVTNRDRERLVTLEQVMGSAEKLKFNSQHYTNSKSNQKNERKKSYGLIETKI